MQISDTVEDDTHILEYKSDISEYKAGIGKKLAGQK